jgi:hypothetical protein
MQLTEDCSMSAFANRAGCDDGFDLVMPLPALCDCGRPVRAGSLECRTCYEDGQRRVWREEYRGVRELDPEEPVVIVPPGLWKQLLSRDTRRRERSLAGDWLIFPAQQARCDS